MNKPSPFLSQCKECKQYRIDIRPDSLCIPCFMSIYEIDTSLCPFLDEEEKGDRGMREMNEQEIREIVLGIIERCPWMPLDLVEKFAWRIVYATLSRPPKMEGEVNWH